MTSTSRVQSTALLEAARRGDVEHLVMAQGRGKNVVFRPFRGANHKTLLHVAAASDQEAVVVWLLSQGANVNALDREGRTPLQNVVSQQAQITVPEVYWSVLERLIEAGTNLDIADQWGRTAVGLAVKRGNHAMVERLLEAGASPSGALGDAVRRKDSDMVDRLLKAGADPNTLYDGSPLLMMAIKSGKTSIIKALLDHGADVNAHDKHGRTALNAAVHSNPVMVSPLLSAGADPNGSDGQLLFEAVQHQNAQTVALLLAAGADGDRPNEKGETLRFVAEKRDNEAILGVLRDWEKRQLKRALPNVKPVVKRAPSRL